MSIPWTETWHRLVRTPEHRALLVGLVPCLVVQLVAIKTARILQARAHWDFTAWVPDLWRSELLVAAGLGCSGLAVLELVRTARARVLALVGCQILAACIVAYELIAHAFFMTTRATFDLSLLAYSLHQPSGTMAILRATAPLHYEWVLLGATAFVVGLPWIIRSQFRATDRGAQASAARTGPRRKLAAASIVAWTLSSFPTLEHTSADFGRANVINAAISLYQLAKGVEHDHSRPRLDDLAISPWSRADRDEPRNIAIIILESVRASSTTVHRPGLATTPFLASLAEQSTVAERAYAVVPHTSKALVAILCGTEPRLRTAISESWPGGLPIRCLPELLADHGYRSAFFQSATETFENRAGLVSNMGFQTFIPVEKMDTGGYETVNYFGKEDAVMLPPSEEWLRAQTASPFLATYLSVTPHHDYGTPARFETKRFAEHEALNRYENAVHYVDGFVEDLLAQYKALDLYEDTLFVIVGDHGEAFGERGKFFHDEIPWNEGLHVPLLIHDPTDPRARTIEHPVSQLDLVPTVVDRLGYAIVGQGLPGFAMDRAPPDRALMAYCWYERRCMSRIGPRWKYIDHFGRRRAEVYDLQLDPGETRNVYDQKLEEVERWRRELDQWRAEVLGFYAR